MGETEILRFDPQAISIDDRQVLRLIGYPQTATVATAAPLNPAYRAPELDFYIADLEARALIVPAESDSPAVAVAESRGLRILRLAIDPAAEATVQSIVQDRKEERGRELV